MWGHFDFFIRHIGCDVALRVNSPISLIDGGCLSIDFYRIHTLAAEAAQDRMKTTYPSE